MAVRRFSKEHPMVFVFGVAILLMVGAYMVPMTSSLGQGVDEHIVTGWQAQLDPKAGTEELLILHQDESPTVIPIHGIPKSAFSLPDSQNASDLDTAVDDLSVIQTAYRENPHAVDGPLGTYDNSATFFHPFSNEPIAYAGSFIKSLSKEAINPATFGGPNIPPGSVSSSEIQSWSNGILQIDTQANGNTITQCASGQVPATLSKN